MPRINAISEFSKLINLAEDGQIGVDELVFHWKRLFPFVFSTNSRVSDCIRKELLFPSQEFVRAISHSKKTGESVDSLAQRLHVAIGDKVVSCGRPVTVAAIKTALRGFSAAYLEYITQA